MSDLGRNERGEIVRDDTKIANVLVELIDIMSENPAFSYSGPAMERLTRLRAFAETIDTAPAVRHTVLPKKPFPYTDEDIDKMVEDQSLFTLTLNEDDYSSKETDQ